MLFKIAVVVLAKLLHQWVSDQQHSQVLMTLEYRSADKHQGKGRTAPQ